MRDRAGCRKRVRRRETGALQNRSRLCETAPWDAQLSLDELRDMVGREGEAFSNRVLANYIVAIAFDNFNVFTGL